MRTSIDIPNDVYREVKVMASRRGTTVRQLVLDGLALVMRPTQPAKKRFELPVIPSKRPGTLHLTNEQIDDITAFS